MDNLKYGIALSGGFAKGASQFVFLKAIIKHINLESVKVLSTSSIGSLNGLALSCGTIKETKDIWRSFHCQSVAQLKKKTKRRYV